MDRWCVTAAVSSIVYPWGCALTVLRSSHRRRGDRAHLEVEHAAARRGHARQSGRRGASDRPPRAQPTHRTRHDSHGDNSPQLEPSAERPACRRRTSHGRTDAPHRAPISCVSRLASLRHPHRASAARRRRRAAGRDGACRAPPRMVHTVLVLTTWPSPLRAARSSPC